MPKQKIIKGRYQIITPKEWKGRGASANTHLVIDLKDSRRIRVIKELQPRNRDPKLLPHYQTRFIQEAKVLEELSKEHNQIPKYYEHFVDKGRFYLVQEYIEGKTLKERLDEEGILEESAVRALLLDVLPILNYVHGKAIHRDIKPENIIVRKKDQKPVLIDFGSVKWKLEEEYDSDGNPLYSTVVTGTHGYMPKEQIGRHPRDVSDLYALGKTSVQLLTGQHPTRLSETKDGRCEWRRYAPDVSEKFAAVIDKAIQEEWQQRFRSAADMIAAVRKSVPRPTLRQLTAKRAERLAKSIVRELLKLTALIPRPKTVARIGIRAIVGIGILGLALFLGNQYYQGLPKSYLSSGEQALKRGDYEQAIEDLDYVISRTPDDVEAYMLRGSALHEQQQYQHAINDFTTYINMRPDDPQGYIARAESRQYACDCKGAEADYTSAINIKGGTSDLYMKRAEFYNSMKNVQAVLADYSHAIELEKTKASNYVTRAEFYLSQDEPQLAIADYTRAIALKKDDSGLYFERANIYYEQSEFSNAKDDYTAFIRLHPDAAGYYNRALCNRYLGSRAEAIKDLDQAISMDGEEPRYYKERGEIYKEEGNEVSAGKDEQKATELETAKTEALKKDRAKSQYQPTVQPQQSTQLKAQPTPASKECGCSP